MTSYKVGQQAYVKEWTTWYLGDIIEVLDGLVVIEANGHKNWLRADYLEQQQQKFNKLTWEA